MNNVEKADIISKTLKRWMDSEQIKDMFLHRNYCTGHLELNIEFNNNNVLDDKLLSEFREYDASACWG